MGETITNEVSGTMRATELKYQDSVPASALAIRLKSARRVTLHGEELHVDGPRGFEFSEGDVPAAVPVLAGDSLAPLRDMLRNRGDHRGHESFAFQYRIEGRPCPDSLLLDVLAVTTCASCVGFSRAWLVELHQVTSVEAGMLEAVDGIDLGLKSIEDFARIGQGRTVGDLLSERLDERTASIAEVVQVMAAQVREVERQTAVLRALARLRD